jgi:ribonuclease HI
MAASYMLYTDGSASPNPGPCGAGAVLLNADEEVQWCLSEYLGKGTNNIGELTAILRGCIRACELGIESMTVYTDSELSVKILNGIAKAKKQHLMDIVENIKANTTDMKIEYVWVKGHADNKWNNFADKLANDALSLPVWNIAKGAKERTPSPEATSKSKMELACPFSEKDEVKKLGAKWDVDKKVWWVQNTPENRKVFAKWVKA